MSIKPPATGPASVRLYQHYPTHCLCVLEIYNKLNFGPQQSVQLNKNKLQFTTASGRSLSRPDYYNLQR